MCILVFLALTVVLGAHLLARALALAPPAPRRPVTARRQPRPDAGARVRRWREARRDEAAGYAVGKTIRLDRR